MGSFVRVASLAIAVALGYAGTVAQVDAQATARIEFAKGNDTGAVDGTVTGKEYKDYILGAKAGQTMSVALSVTDSNGSGTAYFNILPPGSDDVAIFNSSMSAENFGSVELPADGDYTIRVYQMGDDYDSGKTTGFTLSATIM